jgi:hypothetical protein
MHVAALPDASGSSSVASQLFLAPQSALLFKAGNPFPTQLPWKLGSLSVSTVAAVYDRPTILQIAVLPAVIDRRSGGHRPPLQ